MFRLPRTIRRMPDVRKTILARMQTLNMSQYALVQKLKGKVTERTLYAFLAGDSRLNSEALGHVLEALGLDIKPKK